MSSPHSRRKGAGTTAALAAILLVLAGAAAVVHAQKGAQGSAASPASAPGQGRDGPQPMVTATPYPPSLAGAQALVAPAADGAVARGAYLARLGDCVACHTTPGGQPFAGGLPMESPIGTIYSSNITPDEATGIGGYSFEDFDRAVRHGVARGKGSLYPAMPYPSYARVSEQDMKDLFAYFQSVPAVRTQVPDNGIPWPLSMRWPLSVWRSLFAPDPAKVQVAKSSALDEPRLRGAYLVEGLGHCGTCHTPRAFTMQEKGLTAADPRFLSGGAALDGWVAKSLRSEGQDGLVRWSAQDLVDLLRTGRNSHSAVFGGMADVVTHSTQYMSNADLHAIATYLKALEPKPGAVLPAHTYDATVANALWRGDDRQRGAAIYVDSCAACHRTDGRGYQQVFPALAGNSAVLSRDPHNLITIILKGHQVPATSSRPSTFTMPAFGWRLTDAQVADVATFVRSSWGNQAGAVEAGQVARLRKD
ncbi:MAG: cytochrome c [Delftia acidovorans]|jgi:mono/diheme cytochrome c family protein|nr:cytochrome c [Delftia acidovorans]